MESSRTVKYDYAKLFLICCVVLGHLGNTFDANSTILAKAQFWIYLFHMPAFVFVAGLFSKKTIDNKRYDRVIPYFFIYIFMNILSYVGTIIENGKYKASFDVLNETGVPWFALGMVWWGLMAIAVRKVKPAYVLSVSVVLALLIGYCEDLQGWMAIQRAFVFFPFYYLGYALDIKKFTEFTNKVWVRIASLIILVVSAAVSFLCYKNLSQWRNLFKGAKAYANLGIDYNTAYGGIWRLVAMIISLVLTVAVISVMPNRKTFIARFGALTLPVYVFHYRTFHVAFKYIPGFKKWIASSGTAWKCVLFMIVVVLFTSLPPFNFIVKKIMTVPFKKTEE